MAGGKKVVVWKGDATVCSSSSSRGVATRRERMCRWMAHGWRKWGGEAYMG